MTEMLLDWLNTDVKLSKTITNISQDFSSGYLIGELLNKYKQISNFHEYKNKEDSDTKFHNFKLVEKALRDLEIKVDSKRMKEIQEMRKGVAAKFLFSIKMTLSKKEINFEGLLLKKSNQLQKAYTSIKFPNENEKYLKSAINKQSSPGYEQMKALSMSPTKLVGLDKSKLPDVNKNKYENSFMMKEINTIEKILSEDKLLKNEHNQMTKIINEKEKLFHLKNVEKDRDGLQSWTNNIQKKKEWEIKQKINDQKEAEYFKLAILNQFNQSAKENEIQIDKFDRNLSRLGLDVVMIDPKMKKNNTMSSEMVMQKIKEKLDKEMEGKKEKERRNRLINLEQSKAQKDLEMRKREEILKSESVSNNSNSTQDNASTVHQKRLEYENMRVLHERKENSKMKQLMSLKMINQNNSQKSIFNNYSNKFNPEEFLQNLKQENLKFRINYLNRVKIKREKDYKLCHNILNLILDITDEAFQYQKNNNVELIEPKDWRNWMQTFINNDSVFQDKDYFEKDNIFLDEKASTRDKEGFNINSINNVRVPSHSRQQSEYMEISISTLDKSEHEENELLDYLNYLGRWNNQIIPQDSLGTVLKINDVLGNDFFQNNLNNKKNAYTYKEKALEYEPNDDDIENLTIPQNNQKNHFFAEIIEVVIDIKYQDRINVIESTNNINLSKNIYSHIPIKISLIGHQFSGKKTQAKLIETSNTNIKIYSIEELIKRTIENLDKFETPIENNPKFKTLKKNQIDQMIIERQQEEEKFKDFKRIILPIRESIKVLEHPKDDLVVDLLFEYIKQDFPEKDQNLVIEEIIKKYKKKKEIQEELLKIKEEQSKKAKSKVKEEQQFLAELTKLNQDSNKGFVIIDFPQNLEQAKILESRLIGYMEEIDKPKSQSQIIKDKFSMILDREIRNTNSSQLKQGGLDLIIHLEVGNKECVRRAVMRRIDPTTGTIYHLEDNPPNNNDNKLIDRLIPLEDTEEKINNFNLNFDKMSNLISDFYDNFGFQRYNLKTFNNLDGSINKDILNQQLNEFINQIIKINEDKEQEIVNGPLPTEKFSINNTETINNNQSENNRDEIAIIDKNQDHISHVQLLEEEEDLFKYSKKLEESKKKLNQNTVENFYYNFNRLYENYENELKIIFRFFKKQKEIILSNFNRLQIKFIEFLKRPSKKSEEVVKYQIKYNKFIDEYPELKDDPQVKQEFHQDVIDLSDKIWEIIDMRKNEAIEERKKIMTSGWIENEMEKMYTHLEKLFLEESEKFLVSINIIREYYNAMDNKNILIPEMNGIKPSEILSDISILPLEKDNTFPKVEKLFKNCIKLIFKYEDKIKQFDKFMKLNLNQTTPQDSPNKKLVKTTSFKKVNVEVIYQEDKRDIFIYEEEMKNAMRNEKNKFKYRITLLKFWGIDKMTKMRKVANSVYESLDEWIIDTIKSENDAMNHLINRLNNLIEKESKVRFESELDGFDFYKISDFSQLMDFNTTPESFRNLIEIAKFNLNNFKSICDELNSHQIQKNIIRKNIFVEIYIKKYLIDSNNKGIPQTLRDLSFFNFNKFIRFFEINNIKNNNVNVNISSAHPSISNSHKENVITQYNEFIYVKNICVILCLIHCRILDEISERGILANCEEYLINNTFINKEDFMKVEFWFEKDLSSQVKMDDEIYLSERDRVIALKEIIFEIFKEENGMLIIPNLLRILSLRNLHPNLSEIISEAKYQNKTYYEVLLF